MKDKIRFGVIGTSFINKMHIMSINSHPRAEVISVCGRNAERAQEIANQNGVSHVYSDYRELIRNNNLDAVVVGTPDYLQYEMVLLAAKSGLHVASEKPLAHDFNQAAEMLHAVKSRKLHHLTFFTFRWVPHNVRLKELLDEGYVGRILSAELMYLSPDIPGPEIKYDWHYDTRHGTGVLGNIGSHIIHLAQWLVGDIEAATAVSTAHFNRLGFENKDLQQSDDTIFIAVRFSGGAIGSIHASASAVTPDQEQLILIRGTDGTLEAGLNADGPFLMGAKAGEPLKLVAGPDDLWDGVDMSKEFGGRFIEMIQKQSIWDRLFIDDILADIQSAPNFLDGAKVQAVMTAAVQSSTSGSIETVAKI